MEREEILESLFSDPTLKGEKGFFLTSDNQAFAERNKSDGVNHAKNLEEKSLDWFERPKVESDEVKAGVAVDTAKPASAKKLKADAPAPAEAKVEDVAGDIDGTIIN